MAGTAEEIELLQSSLKLQAGISTAGYGAQQPESGAHGSTSVGTLHRAGTYPTPDLLLCPVGRYAVLDDPQSYKSSAIQAALDALGEQATLYLPQETHWTIESTIVLKRHQEIATWGYPTDEGRMALLQADITCEGFILKGTGMEGVRIRNLIIDGRGDKFGYSEKNSAMVQLGGGDGHNQTMDRCTLKNPRQWTCFHGFEGGENVRATNNLFSQAPASDPETEIKFQWTDGISFACRNGLVAGNQIVDARRGAINVLGAPGTLITSNTIIIRNCVSSGGIVMIEQGPHGGNYENTRVVHNTISLEGSYLKTAIAQGHHVWWPPAYDHPKVVLRGGIVMHNLIESRPMNAQNPGAVGYGFVASHVEHWTCTQNLSAPGVIYEGDLSVIQRVWFITRPGPFIQSAEIGPNSDDQSYIDRIPGAKVYSPRFRFQKEFIPADFSGLYCVKAGKLNMLPLRPGELDLKVGNSIKVNGVQLVFAEDGELRLERVASGDVLWSSGSRRFVQGTSDAKLVLTQGGKWIILDGPWTLYDLTPNLPSFGRGEADSDSPNNWKTPQLVISDTMPYISLISAEGSTILATSYRETKGWRPHKNFWILQPTVDGQNTLVSLVNPFGQYVVLQTVRGREISPVEWPLDPQRWKLVWCSPNPATDRPGVPSAIFQEDGNFVIYDDGGKALWDTGTCNPDLHVESIRWGNGSETGPYLSVVDAGGKIVWSTNV